METAFDIVTVACFAGLVIVYFQFTRRDTRTLMHLMVSGAAFAIANQMGNAGLPILADSGRCGRRVRRISCATRLLAVVLASPNV